MDKKITPHENIKNPDNPDCTCDETQDIYHYCPYDEEIEPDEEMQECNCCPTCTQICADDI